MMLEETKRTEESTMTDEEFDMYSAENAVLLANVSSDAQLMKLSAYAEKLSPQMKEVLILRAQTLMEETLSEETERTEKIKMTEEEFYTEENAVLLANVSSDAQLMKMLAYAEKLSPQIKEVLISQAQTLSEKKTEE